MSRRSRQRRVRPATAANGSLAAPRRAHDARLETALVGVIAVKLLGLIVLFDPGNASAFEGPKAAFSLASSAVLAGLVASAVIRTSHRPFLTLTTYTAGAVLATSALAAVFAQDQYVALWGGQRRLGLAFLLDMAVLGAAVAIGVRSRRDWALLALATGVGGVAAIGYGVGQSLGLDPLRWADDVRARPWSTFGNPDKFGHFLGATTAAALAAAALPSPAWPRWARVAALVYAAAGLGMAGLVATRGTLVGLAAALPALGVLYLLVARRASVTSATPRALAAAAALVVIAGAVVIATPLGERVRAGFGDVASQQRVILAEAALEAFAARPLTGHGVDNFGVVYPTYRPARASPFIGQDHAHSWPLQALATVGLPGALALAALAAASLFSLFRSALAGREAAAPLLIGGIAYWSHGLVAFGSVSVDWIAWVVAGGAVAVQQESAHRTVRRVPAAATAALVAAGMLLALSASSALAAGRELHAARNARPPDQALAPARRAVELDPGRAEHWFALAGSHRERRQLVEAARAYREAAERAPYEQAYWSNLAVTLADVANRGDQTLGGKGAAIEAARRAVAADPRSPRPHVIRAIVANALGDTRLAFEAITEAIRLHPIDPDYDEVAAQIALRSDPAAARAALERIVAIRDSAVLRVGLAQAALRASDPAAARTHLARALELDPQNQAAKDLTRQVGP